MLAILPIHFYLILLIIIYKSRVGPIGWANGCRPFNGLLSQHRVERSDGPLGKGLGCLPLGWGLKKKSNSIFVKWNDIQYVHLLSCISSLSRARTYRLSFLFFHLLHFLSNISSLTKCHSAIGTTWYTLAWGVGPRRGFCPVFTPVWFLITPVDQNLSPSVRPLHFLALPLSATRGCIRLNLSRFHAPLHEVWGTGPHGGCCVWRLIYKFIKIKEYY